MDSFARSSVCMPAVSLDAIMVLTFSLSLSLCILLNCSVSNGSAATFQARMMSGPGMSKPITVQTQPSFAKTWFSDPATYPILGVGIFALSGVAFFITYKATQCPDVRMSGRTKGEVVRTW
jgi:hypothetical protein